MPNLHGAPDYYQYRRDSVTFPLADLAELAARFGAVRSFDGRGDVAWYESFEYGLLHWEALSSPAGGAAVPSVSRSSHGGLSVELTTAGSDANLLSLQRSVPYRTSGLIGIEAGFLMDEELSSFRLAIAVYHGGEDRNYVLRYRSATDDLQVLTGPAAWTTISTGAVFGAWEAHFNFLKLVIDPTKHLYHRVLANSLEFPDLALSPADAGAETEENVFLSLYLYGNADQVSVAYVDSVIYTWDEPA